MWNKEINSTRDEESGRRKGRNMLATLAEGGEIHDGRLMRKRIHYY